MSRAVLQVFESYQQARTQFVQTVAELSSRPQNIETLQNANVLQLLRPLLLDAVPSIQQSAALALGRLANYSESLAESIVVADILPQLVYSLSDSNRFFKKTAAFVLKSIAKHSPELANACVECGAVEALTSCLNEFDSSVREASAWALGYIAQHNQILAQSVVDSGSIPLLVGCMNEPELSLRRISLSTLSEVTRHSLELAQAVVDASVIPNACTLMQHSDAKIKRQSCALLAQIAKHSADLAELIVENDIFPKCFVLLNDPDKIVSKNAATLIREIVKHSAELSALVVNTGGHAALIQLCQRENVSSGVKLPAVMALGYIASFGELLATAIIVKQGLLPLKQLLVAQSEEEEHIRAASVWAVGQLGRHTTDHARAVAQADLLRPIAEIVDDPRLIGSDLREKAQKALKAILSKCTYAQALEPILLSAVEQLLRTKGFQNKTCKYLLQQFSKILPNDSSARKSFVTSKCLAAVQQLKQHLGQEVVESDREEASILSDLCTITNGCFPVEIVQYYSPNYAEQLIQRMGDA